MFARTAEIRALIHEGVLLTGPVRARSVHDAARVRAALALAKR
jgi:hypothetical protein